MVAGTMLNLEAQSGLLLLIYQSIETPEHLGTALSALAELVGAARATVVRTEPSGQTILASGSARAWNGRLPELGTDEIVDSIGVRILPLAGGYELVLDHSDPAPERIEHLVRLAPHLARALRLSDRLAAHSADFLVKPEALDRLDIGIGLLDGDGRVISLNRAAQRFVGSDAALIVREQRIVPRSSGTRALFNMVLEQSLTAKRGRNAGQSGGRLKMSEKDGTPVQLVIVPLAAQTMRGQCALVVLLFSPRLGNPDPESYFVAHLGLQADEARFAASLLAGRNPLSKDGMGTEDALLRLRALFDKLGTTRQGDLLRLMLGGCGEIQAKTQAG